MKRIKPTGEVVHYETAELGEWTEWPNTVGHRIPWPEDPCPELGDEVQLGKMDIWRGWDVGRKVLPGEGPCMQVIQIIEYEGTRYLILWPWDQ